MKNQKRKKRRTASAPVEQGEHTPCEKKKSSLSDGGLDKEVVSTLLKRYWEMQCKMVTLQIRVEALEARAHTVTARGQPYFVTVSGNIIKAEQN